MEAPTSKESQRRFREDGFLRHQQPLVEDMEKYAAAQMALMMRGLSIFNTFGPLTGLVAILSTSELFPVACAFLPWNFLCAARATRPAILRAILRAIL